MPDEKSEFLNAVGRRDVDLDLTTTEIEVLRKSMTQLATTARLSHVAADRPESTAMDELLAAELRRAAESPAFEILERTQLSTVLDEQDVIIRRLLKVTDVPPEDEVFLAQCGVRNPKDEIVISVTRIRAGYLPIRSDDGDARSQHVGTAEIFEYSRTRIVIVAARLAQDEPEAGIPIINANDPKKRKKVFNGIGKILSGVVAATGNVLIGAGAIPATGGAAVAGVIASAAVSVGLVMQGIGDLRGE